MRTRCLATGLLAVPLWLIPLVFVPGCGESPPAAGTALADTALAEPAIWTTGSWPSSAPEEQGMDSSRLVDLVTEVRARTDELHLHSLLIVRHGTVVLDAHFYPYDGVRPHDLASCTKSLTSLAVGIALERDADRRLDAPLGSYFDDGTMGNDDARKSRMTLRHALTMTSGMSCDEPGSLLAMQAAPDWLAYAFGLPMAAEAGTTFRYCSTVSHLLSGVVSRLAGVSADQLLEQHLLAPVGIDHIDWPVDAQGVAHGWGDARLAPRDLARVGLVMLHRGRWAVAQLIASSWVDAATRPQTTASPTAGYGYQWWTDASGAFYASGRGGQYLYVVPTRDLLVVSTGSASPAGVEAYSELLQRGLFPAIVAEGPVAANPSAAAVLGELASAVAEADEPRAAPSLPVLPPDVEGRWYDAAPNALGWEGLALSFAGAEATLTVRIAGAQNPLRIGLDGVARLTRGVRFASALRYADADVALAGRFTDSASFELRFDTIDRIDAGTIVFKLRDAGASIDVDLFERTFLLTHMLFSATRSPSP